MITAELVLTDVISESDIVAIRELFENNKDASSLTVENYMNHDNILETVKEMELITYIALDVYGEDFFVEEPIIVGRDIGDISRKIVIRLHDIVTELQWKE